MLNVQKSIIAAAIAMAAASPVSADSARDFAFRHVNASAEHMGDVQRVPEAPTLGVNVSSRGRSAIELAVRNHNESADKAGDAIGATNLTAAPRGPVRAAEIFARIAEETRGN
ncbi:hypothetical protein [Jannaschia ovalis]|uniref:Uncharacterized protein n=1 Tax=Jannaschia ovalis TaxID=3038773 RepID=A0ABY8LGW0_9RHOB|nr:hypothetical protein [Jannaschia sp. GRR-S6-38]WGH79590.1 hypothetical protein P8627_04825 [Jannaschia sp. GRR-S6-38]